MKEYSTETTTPRQSGAKSSSNKRSTTTPRLSWAETRGNKRNTTTPRLSWAESWGNKRSTNTPRQSGAESRGNKRSTTTPRQSGAESRGNKRSTTTPRHSGAESRGNKGVLPLCRFLELELHHLIQFSAIHMTLLFWWGGRRLYLHWGYSHYIQTRRQMTLILYFLFMPSVDSPLNKDTETVHAISTYKALLNRNIYTCKSQPIYFFKESM